MWPRIACSIALALVVLTAPGPHDSRTWADEIEKAAQAPAYDLDALLKAIHSDNFSQRDKATTDMLKLPAEERSHIEHALSRESDVEAVARLSKVALHLFLKDRRQTPLQGEAGLLGIALATEPIGNLPDARPELVGQIAIHVIETKPGFPAYEVLRPGDRIIMIDDEPMGLGFSIETFRAKIASKTPGSFLNVTLLRNGTRVRTPVQIAGLQQPGESFLINFVERRAMQASAYLKLLRPAGATKALVIHDDTPADVNIYNDVEYTR